MPGFKLITLQLGHIILLSELLLLTTAMPLTQPIQMQTIEYGSKCLQEEFLHKTFLILQCYIS